MMRLTDVVAVIGVKTPATALIESLCCAVGMPVFYAMKRADSSQRIESCDDEATILSPFDALSDSIFRLGLMASNSLFEDGTLDCNLTEDREMFERVLGWFANSVKSPSDLPADWVLSGCPTSPMEAGFDPRFQQYAKGKILADGKMVVDFGQGNRLVQLPAQYHDVLSTVDGFCS